MVVFAVLFGWRESTLREIERHDVFISSEGVLSFSESFCKRFQTLSGNPYRVVTYDCTLIEGLPELFRWYVGTIGAQDNGTLLWQFGTAKVPALTPTLLSVLKRVGSDQVAQPHLTGHSCRVSCCSALFACNVDPSTISLWCGWTVAGCQWHEYLRLIPRHEVFMRIHAHLLGEGHQLCAQLRGMLRDLRESVLAVTASGSNPGVATPDVAVVDVEALTGDSPPLGLHSDGSQG